MANTEELHEHPSTQYARHFDIWLKDFKDTISYMSIVITVIGGKYTGNLTSFLKTQFGS